MFCIDEAFWTAHIPPNDRPQIKTFIFRERSALKCVLVEENQWEQTAKKKQTNTSYWNTAYMVKINGDNTFYLNRVTFWVFSEAYYLLSDAPFHPISNFLEGLRMSHWGPLFYLALDISFGSTFCAFFERFVITQNRITF